MEEPPLPMGSLDLKTLSDEALLQRLFDELTAAAIVGTPYGEGGNAFADALRRLPEGLRAMAATHWLDLSLTLDDLAWHFGNFESDALNAEIAAGLDRLGLSDLSDLFRRVEAYVRPRLRDDQVDKADFNAWQRFVTPIEPLIEQAWTLNREDSSNRSAIYAAWVRYARRCPEHVFLGQSGQSLGPPKTP